MDELVARDIGADAVCEPGHRISTDKSALRRETPRRLRALAWAATCAFHRGDPPSMSCFARERELCHGDCACRNCELSSPVLKNG
jgi:hypothetical protein